jgi:hypothetical protein
MMALFRDGGWSMYWVVAFGFVALGAAAYFAARPTAGHEAFIQWMSRALLWAVLTGMCSDVGTVMRAASARMGAAEVRILEGSAAAEPADGETRARLVCEGLAESLSPGIVGFAFLGVVALLAAVGRRRLDAMRS